MKMRFILLTALAALLAAPAFADADSGANGSVSAAPTASTDGAWR